MSSQFLIGRRQTTHIKAFKSPRDGRDEKSEISAKIRDLAAYLVISVLNIARDSRDIFPRYWPKSEI